MAAFRRQKSKKERAVKAAKDARKAAKGTALQVSKRRPLARRLPLIVGAGIAALVATKLVRGRGGHPAAA